MDEEVMYGIAAVVATLFAGLTILVPVMTLTLRFALRPALETWARVRQGQAPEQQRLLEQRMAVLEGEVQQIQHTVQSLRCPRFSPTLGRASAEPPHGGAPDRTRPHPRRRINLHEGPASV